jgi:cytochrome c oxidase subunit IV
MAHHNDTAAVQAQPNNTKAIWRTLGILSAITIIELIVGMAWAPGAVKANPSIKIWFNIFYLICTLFKAYFIVAEFMHLGHEVKNLIMTIIFPLMLFIWFIIAFLWEGNSYKALRDTYNPKIPIKTEHHTPTQHGEGTPKKVGENH